MSWKLERKKKEIENVRNKKSRQLEKVGSQKKQEIGKSRK